MTTLVEMTQSKTESELIRDIAYEDPNKWECCNGYHSDNDMVMVDDMAMPWCPKEKEIF